MEYYFLVKMGRKQNQVVWDCFTKHEKGATCKFCQKRYMVANVNKMESHLIACLRVPDETRKVIREMQNKKVFDDQSSKSLSTSDISDLDSSNSSALLSSTPVPKKKNISNFFDNLSNAENVSSSLRLCML